jgi:hypothetical protein
MDDRRHPVPHDIVASTAKPQARINSKVGRLHTHPPAKTRHDWRSLSWHAARNHDFARTCSMNSSRPLRRSTRATSRSALSGSSACRCPTRPWTPSYRRSSCAPSTTYERPGSRSIAQYGHLSRMVVLGYPTAGPARARPHRLAAIAVVSALGGTRERRNRRHRATGSANCLAAE